MTPTLSIIIPIYNVEAYLAECLESVLAQDSSNVEVIMVNDCSTDSSRAIANEYVSKFSSARLIDHETNCGLGPTRNSAISAAIGQFLLMLDSDDWLARDAIENVLSTIDAESFDIAQFGCSKIYQNNVEPNLYMNFCGEASLLQKQQALLSLPNYVWLKIYRREFIQAHNFKFENTLYEDIPWSIMITLAAKTIVLRNLSIYIYRQRPNSIISSRSKRHLDLLKVYKNLFDTLNTEELPHVLVEALHNAFINAAYYLYRQRHTRLGKENYGEFNALYSELLSTHEISASTIRTQIMSLITRTKIILGS